MSRTIEVKAVVDIPQFVAPGLAAGDDDVLVHLSDVRRYLMTVAAAFDNAGANADIGLTLRAIRDGMADPQLTRLPTAVMRE